MIRHLKARNFKAVPHLETSGLMKAHPDGVAFSDEKVNVLVGPNGIGKSSLIAALSYETLTYFNSVSSFDDEYTEVFPKALWVQVGKSYSNDYAFLPGLHCDSDKAPALYYRPGHIPGNKPNLTHALVHGGYSREVHRYGELTDKKSSGQQASAVLGDIKAVLAGDVKGIRYGYTNWKYGKQSKELERNFHSFDYQAEILKKLYGSASPDAKPVVLMDEPEQSLDAMTETQLWKLIAGADCSRVQVIVATHSLYPLMHPEQFNLIEAVPGYAAEVRSML
jgi:energy-coupling factor transporter ATP-binding protein EcfA2